MSMNEFYATCLYRDNRGISSSNSFIDSNDQVNSDNNAQPESMPVDALRSFSLYTGPFHRSDNEHRDNERTVEPCRKFGKIS